MYNKKFYSKVVRYDNWCSTDLLENKELLHNEKVIVTWPDKTITTELVHVEKYIKYGYDHRRHEIPHYHAYVIKQYKTIDIKVPLVNLEVSRY
jgi:hypothetical protein